MENPTPIFPVGDLGLVEGRTGKRMGEGLVGEEGFDPLPLLLSESVSMKTETKHMHENQNIPKPSTQPRKYFINYVQIMVAFSFGNSLCTNNHILFL